ncbi:tetratricopeptide repeat protein [Solimonas sp. K1W22B-7]|uniref:tetratricopeptide repeat protein n=1 Tax=Solimonas sp. K1W22B-7 TaxID=2303331 RepID=UPI000E32D831|nr:tetratricopeptide repeat protein [Solimonas sp. K1W22B-7]AXQ30752.1 tetratricopeptide repeat protein [Solimonas sp. K1W22B-7]
MAYRRLFTGLLLVLIGAIVWRALFGAPSHAPGKATQPGSSPAGLSAPAEPPQVERGRKLLDARSYGALEEWLADLRAAHTRKASVELPLYEAYAAFDDSDPALREQISLWIQKRPESAEARLVSAIQRLRAAEDTQAPGSLLLLAKEDAGVALATDPGHPLAWWALVRATAALEGGEAVPSLHERLMRNAPAAFYAHRALLGCLQPSWGGSYEAMQDYAAKLQAGAAANPRLEILQGLPHAVRAKAALAAGDEATAEQEYDLALAYGDDPDFLADRAALRIRLLRFSDAMADYRRQLEKFPSRESRQALASAQERMRERAYVLHRGDQQEQALRAYDAFRELWPDDHGVLLYQGLLYAALGRHADALVDYRRLLKLDPSNFEAVKAAQDSLGQSGRWDEAIVLWNAYIDRVPDKSQAYMERGSSHFHKGDKLSAYDDAARACDQGLPAACVWKDRLLTDPAVKAHASA